MIGEVDIDSMSFDQFETVVTTKGDKYCKYICMMGFGRDQGRTYAIFKQVAQYLTIIRF